MKRKVLLVFPDTGETYNLNVPLALIWVAAPLHEAGYEVIIFDHRLEPDYKRFIARHAEELVCVGVTSFSGPQLHGAMEISKWVKAAYPALPVVWGGWHVSILTEQSMREPFIDYIIHGQGEIPFLELVTHLRDGEDPKGIDNLAYRDASGQPVINPKRPLVDINTLPRKPYHLVDIEKYAGRKLSKDERYLVWMSSVGCPFNCGFCADPLVYKRRWLALTPQRMADEIEEIVNAFGITQFGFWDDNFFIDFNRAEAFIDEINRRGIKIKWTGTIRISAIRRMPMELLRKCREAGLHMVHPGVEGATQEMLDFMNKKEKAEDTIPAARKLAEVGVKSLYSFIIGLPDEPASNMQDTFDMIEELKRINPDNIMPVNFYTPYPGNHLYDMSIERGFVPPKNMQEWADFNTRVGITPWLTEHYRDEAWKRDKYYYPAAYPSKVMRDKMDKGGMRFVYRAFHAIARWRVSRRNFRFDWDWKLLYSYWRFWGKYNKKLKFLPNINFRW
ncbi:MAG: B12-binding domain-containing radical SAM protein [Thermodesulfobacteriota bacterium]